MNKSTFFAGQPIFTQLAKLLPKHIISNAVRDHDADKYCKKFDTWHHLITMLYACYQQCTSLREITTGMRACEGRLQSLGIKHLPARSTFAEANARRDYKVFEQIYLKVYAHYKHVFPDSHCSDQHKKVVIVDSTSISLFKEIMQGNGSTNINGRKKGGVKVHTAMLAHEDVPFFIDLTRQSQADVSFLAKLQVPANSIVLLDRGYNNYNKFYEWQTKQIDWVTLKRADASIEITGTNEVDDEESAAGVIRDELITMGSRKSRSTLVQCRLVTYYVADKDATLQFVTNNKEWKASKVAALYKGRWQIELLFKRLKQNMPLQYFLGDNENAIKAQIYCVLIADLLLKISIHSVKRKWAFSNITCLVRLHLMNYTDLLKFLENPEKASILNPMPQNNSPQLHLFRDTWACY